jgi:putative superfamily III holin-X
MTDISRTSAVQTPAPTVPEEPSIGTLVAEASRDVSTLLRTEIALAKAELKVSARAGGAAVGLFGGAAYLLVLATVMFFVAVAYFLHMTGLDLAWCFLIVFGLLVLLAALLGFLGYRKVRRVKPPERAITQAQETKKVFLERG